MVAIAPFIPLLGTVIDRVFPDKEAADKAKLELLALQNTSEAKMLEHQMSSILAEANGESWLQRNWRPLTMLTFVSLVVAKWLGFTAPGITEALELKLFDIIQIGLGGYVIGRSAEKVAKALPSKELPCLK